MKKRFLSLIFIECFCCSLFSQITWEKLDSVVDANRYYATSISINGKGYYGLGLRTNGYCSKDWWQFDPVKNKWSRKADCPVERYEMRGFTIGDKCYLSWGMRNDGFLEYYIYEYNSVLDTWKNIGNTPFSPDGVGFSINGKGYHVMGRQGSCNGSIPYDDREVWEFDPQNYSWKQKQKFPGELSGGISVAVVNDKAYFQMGELSASPSPYSKDFWEYTPATDTWVKKKDFPGIGRNNCTSFSIGQYVFVTEGERMIWHYNNTGAYLAPIADFWRYDTKNDEWSKLDSIPALPRTGSSVLSFEDYAYVLGGLWKDQVDYKAMNEVWKLKCVDCNDPDNNPENNLSISVFPNPSHSTITIGSATNYATSNYLIIKNILGETVLEKTVCDPDKTFGNIDLSNFQKGTYVVEVFAGTKKMVQKIVVE